MKSAKVVELFANQRRTRSAEELAFLPAALEIVETPPSPAGRAIGICVILIFCIGLAWAAFGQIDIVASAQGRIVPSDRVKVIQPMEIGVVRTLVVEDGQRVKAGDVLLEIDSTINDAEARQARRDLRTTRLDIARLRAALSDSGDPIEAFKPPADADPQQASDQRRFLESQVAEHRAKVGALDRQRQQKEAEVEATAATVAKLEAMIPVLQQRFEIRRHLASQELGSKLQYLEMLQALTEMQQELKVQQNNTRVGEAAAAAIGESRAQAVAEYRRGLFDELGKMVQKENGLAETLVKSEQKAKLQALKAPVDGTVQQLAVHTIGGVVTPSQELMVVVPANSRLEIEANIPNRDIGFIQAGQEAEIKVDTFNFTKYGLIHGHVLSFSQDSIKRPKPSDPAKEKSASSVADTSEPQGQEMVYQARISLEQTDMLIDGKRVQLSPGMAVTAEIKTGSRSVLSYLLSPIQRFHQESMRER
jgi:membrane fusion protein, hemolysin D